MLKLHDFGPYGNKRDIKVQHFIGVPLSKLHLKNKSTLCGEDQVVNKDNLNECGSHQESRSPTLFTILNKADLNFDRNVGFVAGNTSNSDLPSGHGSSAYLQVVDAVHWSGVPNHRGVCIRLVRPLI